MTPNACDCGRVPAVTERTLDVHQVVQVKCVCGAHGGAVTYLKPSDAERTRWAAVDGWNFEHPIKGK